jgi:hypothetical protein
MGKRIIQYGMATAHNHHELLDYVNDAITAGYQPYGYVFQTTQHEQNFIHQPMVMYDLKKKIFT